MRRARLSLLLILPYCLLELSCGHNLSRSTAAKLINMRLGYPKPETTTIEVGNNSLSWRGDNPDLFQSKEAARLKKYRDAGLVRIEDVKVSTQDNYYHEKYSIASFTVELTEEGRQYFISQGKNYVTVRQCSWVLAEVTGIAFSEGKTQARVDFRCSDMTPFGKLDGLDETKLEEHSIGMQLYDDGWRA